MFALGGGFSGEELLVPPRHFAQLVRGYVQRAQLLVLLCELTECVRPDGIDVAERAAAEGRESDAVDQGRIQLGGAIDDAVLQTAHRFDAHGHHQAVHDLLLLELAARGHVGSEQLPYRRVHRLLGPSLLVQLVDVVALAILLTEPAALEENLAAALELVAHAIGVALGHDVARVHTRVYADDVAQVRGPHGPAELLHRLVDVLEVSAVAKQGGEAEDVGEDDPVHQEARAVAHDHRLLPQGQGVAHRAPDRGIARLRAADDLHQRHAVYGVEEVHAAEVLRAGQRLRQQIDGDGRGVGGEDGVAADLRLHLGQHHVLDLEILDDRLDDQVDAPEVSVAQGRRDLVQHRRHLVRRHAPAPHELGQELRGLAEPQVDTGRVDVLHDDRDALVGRLVRDPATHDPRPQHRGLLDGLGTFRVSLGDLSEPLIGQEEVHEVGGDIRLGQLGEAPSLDLERLVAAQLPVLFDGLHRGDRRRVVLSRLGRHEGLGRGERHEGFDVVQLHGVQLFLPLRAVVEISVDAALQQMQRGLAQLIGLHHRIDRTHAERRRGILMLSGGDPLHAVVGADHPGEPDRAAEAGNDAQLDFGEADLGRAGHDAVVRRERQLQAAAQDIAVDRGDGGKQQVFDGIEDLVGLEDAVGDVLLALLELADELRDVRADDEGVLGAGDQQSGDAAVRCQRGDRFLQLSHGQIVELVD